MYCSDVKMASCQHDCYGQGKCQEHNVSKASNITVGSCVCTNAFTGHLCAQLSDRKEYVPYVPPNILAATAFCGLVAVFAVFIIKWNADQDAIEEYEKIKHSRPSGIAPKAVQEVNDVKEADAAAAAEENEGMRLIDSDTEDEEEMNLIVYK